MKKSVLITISMLATLNAQDLKTTVEDVLSTNPAVLERLKNYNSTQEDITSARSGYYPKLDLTLGVGREKTDKHSRPNNITDEKFDFTVYQNTLTLTQNIFNGFKTNYAVEQQKSRTISAAYSYIERVNDTAFELVDSYIQVMKNEELLQTSKENVEINEEISVKVKKLYDSGLTTLSEVNKIDSSLALAKSNYIVQENTLLDATYSLQRILGRYLDPSTMIEPSVDVELPKNIESATQYAMQNNPSLLVSKYNIKLAQDTYQEKKAPFLPSVDVEITQSMNKNLSTVEGKEDKLKAMVYMNYNLFNGLADSSAIQKSISEVHREVLIKDDLRRDVIKGLNLSWAAYEKLSAQLKHLEDYKRFSLKTLTLYTKEYDLGRRSLLDLLSAQNDFIGSKSQIINTKYNILFAKYRIMDAMGTLVSSIMGEKTDYYYNNVGLNGKTPVNNDSLPVQLDSDNDLIVDEKDICSNSLPSDMKDIYGCKTILSDTMQIERYSGFLFSSSSTELTSEGEDNFSNLVKQLKEYGLENIKFDILGNADVDGMSQEDSLLLSSKRAELIKELLINNGAMKNGITTYKQSNKAPIYTNGTLYGKKLNNRVDIIVKKIKK